MLKKTKVQKRLIKNNGEFVKDLSKVMDDTSITLYVNSFTEESAKQFYLDFNKALRHDQTLIPILIDSYGGYVDSLLFMMDLIESSPVPVATFAVGKAMSCGSILLTCGTPGMRFIAPTARVMIHNVSSATWGKHHDMAVDVKETERLQQVAFHKMAKNCGKPKNYFLDQLKKKGNTDWFLTPEDAKKHGLVNHVKVPIFSTNIIVQNIIT